MARRTCNRLDATAVSTLCAECDAGLHRGQLQAHRSQQPCSPQSATHRRCCQWTTGRKLISQVLQQFCEGKVDISYFPPSTPWINGYIKTFNNRLRKECLNRNHWSTLFEACAVIGDFKGEHPTR